MLRNQVEWNWDPKKFLSKPKEDLADLTKFNGSTLTCDIRIYRGIKEYTEYILIEKIYMVFQEARKHTEKRNPTDKLQNTFQQAPRLKPLTQTSQLPHRMVTTEF